MPAALPTGGLAGARKGGSAAERARREAQSAADKKRARREAQSAADKAAAATQKALAGEARAAQSVADSAARRRREESNNGVNGPRSVDQDRHKNLKTTAERGQRKL